MNFIDQLKVAKPKAAESSLKTYNTILKKAYTIMFGKTESPDKEKFREKDKVFS